MLSANSKYQTCKVFQFKIPIQINLNCYTELYKEPLTFGRKIVRLFQHPKSSSFDYSRFVCFFFFVIRKLFVSLSILLIWVWFPGFPACSIDFRWWLLLTILLMVIFLFGFLNNIIHSISRTSKHLKSWPSFDRRCAIESI